MRKRMLGVVLVALGALAVPAVASKATYTRRFENRTSVALGVYEFDFEGSRWDYRFTVYPGIPVVQRDLPKRGLESRRLLWGVDVGMDGAAIDLQRNDFGTVDWRWTVGESVPR